MSNAVIRTGGKQFCVAQGQRVKIPAIKGEVGADVSFEDVLALAGDSPRIARPKLAGVKVLAKIVAQGLEQKIIVFKFKKRKRYKRKMGHRQRFTQVEITSIAS